MTPLRLALLSLVRRRVPSALALAAIALSIAASGVLFRLYLLSQSRFSSLAFGGDAVAGSKAGPIALVLGALNLEGPYPRYIPQNLYDSVRSQQEVKFADGATHPLAAVKHAVPLLFFGRYQGYRVVGTDEGILAIPGGRLKLAAGRFPRGPEELLLGSAVAEATGKAEGARMGFPVWNGPDDSGVTASGAVVGVLAPSGTAWDRALFANLGWGQSLLAQGGKLPIWKEKIIHYMLLTLPPESYPGIESLVNSRSVAEITRVDEATAALHELSGTGGALGAWLSCLIVLLGGLAVGGMMVARFEAMATSLAVLRALGYAKRTLLAWLFWEGVLLGGAACVLGGLADGALFPIVRSALGQAVPAPEVASVSLCASFPVWIAAMLAVLLPPCVPLARLCAADVHRSLKGL